MDTPNQFDTHGKNLAPIVIEALNLLRTTNIKRMETEASTSPLGTTSPVFIASHRQLAVLNEIINLGNQPTHPYLLARILQLSFIDQELYSIESIVSNMKEKS